MVGRQVLALVVEVRILGPEPKIRKAETLFI